MRKIATSVARRLCRNAHQSVAQTIPAQITTLPNKIRVATESTPGHFSSVGLYVDAGSRYETPSTSGVSHFLDRMAFKTTGSHSESDMSRAMDALGGQIMCAASREVIMYQSSHFHSATPQALSLISETVQNASFLPEELTAQREAARYEMREICAKPDMILPEVLHQVAYDNKTLGNPLLCPDDRIDLVDETALREFLRDWYRPERMVIAGAGMRHEELVELTDKYFSSLKSQTPPSTIHLNRVNAQHVPPHLLPSPSSSWPKSLTRAASSYFSPSNGIPSELPLAALDTLRATYTGGYRFLPSPSAEFNHVYVAYESVGIHDEDIYTLATMQILLGGGGSFSAGGPGKGMYSRLYMNILNHFTQIDHCASFHHIYTDSSLFGLFASVQPTGSSPSQIMPHLVHQLSLLLYTPVPKIELERAKNQLKSSLMMALESRPIEVEDLGRQILVHGRKVTVAEMVNRIDEVTPDTLRRVANRIFGPESGNKATVLCMGKEDVGDWQAVFRKYGTAGA